MVNNTDVAKYICCICAGFILAGCIFYIGPSRKQSQRIEELESALTTRERELVNSNERISELIARLREHNDRAGELVKSVGDQLVKDAGTITSTTELINLLRAQMQNLESYYKYICSDSSDIYESINLGDN